MMELVPEQVGDAIVLNAVSVCPQDSVGCGFCGEYAAAIRNWLLIDELTYIIIDLQDEKELCPSFLIELVQLRKRLRCPFYFVGVMDKSKDLLSTYDVSGWGPILDSPEAAIEAIRTHSPEAFRTAPIDEVKFGEPIPVARPRPVSAMRPEEAPQHEEAGAAAEDL